MELIQHSITQQVSSRYRTSLTNVPQETPEQELFVSTVPAVFCFHFCIFPSRRRGDGGSLICSEQLLQPFAFSVNSVDASAKGPQVRSSDHISVKVIWVLLLSPALKGMKERLFVTFGPRRAVP